VYADIYIITLMCLQSWSWSWCVSSWSWCVVLPSWSYSWSLWSFSCLGLGQCGLGNVSGQSLIVIIIIIIIIIVIIIMVTVCLYVGCWLYVTTYMGCCCAFTAGIHAVLCWRERSTQMYQWRKRGHTLWYRVLPECEGTLCRWVYKVLEMCWLCIT